MEVEERCVRNKRERKPTNVEAGGVDRQLCAMFRHVAVWAYEDELRFLCAFVIFLRTTRTKLYRFGSAAVRQRRQGETKIERKLVRPLEIGQRKGTGRDIR